MAARPPWKARWAGCRRDALEWRGLPEAVQEAFHDAMSVHRDEWVRELLLHEELFIRLYDDCRRSSCCAASCCWRPVARARTLDAASLIASR